MKMFLVFLCVCLRVRACVWHLQEELHVLNADHTHDFHDKLNKMQEKKRRLQLSDEERAIVEQRRARQKGVTYLMETIQL